MGYDIESLLFPVGTSWILHQGPAAIHFELESMPGDYVVRLRVDNFMAPDSRFDNQCCWSNALGR